MVVWIRYRYLSTLVDSPLEWRHHQIAQSCLNPDNFSNFKEFLGRQCQFYNTPHYGGVEIEQIDHPPKEYLEDEISIMTDLINYYTETILRYQEMLDELS